jgi:hypothetical protein
LNYPFFLSTAIEEVVTPLNILRKLFKNKKEQKHLPLLLFAFTLIERLGVINSALVRRGNALARIFCR